MKRICFDEKTKDYIWKDWIPNQNSNFGESCVQKKKYIKDKVRINNQEVSTGNNRVALYSMPNGIDNGVRYSALYETSGLDITEINAVKNSLEAAKEKVTEAVKMEMQKNLDKIPKANVNDNQSTNTDSKE